MKKKIFIPKILVVSGLCLMCVGVLAGILYWNSLSNYVFTPNADTSVGSNDTWQDTAGSLPTNGDTQKNTGDQMSDKEKDAADDNYKVSSESEKGVIIDMTPPAEKPKAPDTPAGEKPNIDNSVPNSPASGGECTPSTPDKPTEPIQPGKVYDPVFGWIEPSVGVGETVGSDGDPDKMVGSMG